MAGNRTANYTFDEDRHLCHVYIDITQDAAIGINQGKKLFWRRVKDTYNSSKPNITMQDRNERSVQCRMQQIISAVSHLNACIAQVEYTNPSGFSEQDILESAKQLFVQDQRFKKGFKYEHVWPLLKNFVKFDNQTRRSSSQSQRSSSQSETVPESPISPPQGLSSFDLNLSDENVSGSASSHRPEGAKKSKLKRKKGEDMSTLVDTLKEENQKLRDILTSSQEKKDRDVELMERKIEAQKQKAEAQTRKAEAQRRQAEATQWAEENKVLMINLDTIADPSRREYFRREQERIIQKREEQLQQPRASTFNMFGEYFQHLGGSGSGLADF